MPEKNEDHLLGQVDPFIELAKKRGVYSSTQATNLKFALGLARGQLGEEAGATTTVGQLKDQADALLDKYGGENRATSGTIRTYKSRAVKVLQDYIQWNNGDFMKWKDSVAKKPARRQRKRSTIVDPNDARDEGRPLDGGLPDMARHDLKVPGGRTAQLWVPEPFSSRDLSAIWRQLDALKTYLEAQSSVDDESDADDDE